MRPAFTSVSLAILVGILAACATQSGTVLPNETRTVASGPPTPSREPERPVTTAPGLPTRPSATIAQTAHVIERTQLFAGPGNVDYVALAWLPPSTAITLLGTFGDFVKVQVDTNGTTQTGYLHRASVDAVPDGLPVLQAGDVPPVKIDESNLFLDPQVRVAGSSINIKNDTARQYAVSPVRFSLTSDLTFSLQLKSNPPGQAGLIRLVSMSPDLAGAPLGQVGIRSMDLFIDPNGNIWVMVLRDGAATDDEHAVPLDISGDRPISIRFLDASGKLFVISDAETGRIYKKIDTSVYTYDLASISLPGGLFPEAQFFVGPLLEPHASMTITNFAVTMPATGAWIASGQSLASSSPASTSAGQAAAPTAGSTAAPAAIQIPPPPRLIGTAAPSLPAAAFQNKVYQEGDAYIFEYLDNNVTLKYIYLPATGSLHDLQAQVNHESPFYPSNYGGPSLTFNGGQGLPVGAAGQKFQVSHLPPILDATGVQITWRASSDSDSILFTYHFSISGKTLRVDVTSDSSDISQFSLDRSEGTPGPRLVKLPYLTTIRLLLFRSHFVSAYFDWTRSHASGFETSPRIYSNQSAYFGQVADYQPRSDNSRNPLQETAFITVSDNLHEVLPGIPNPPSPYRQLLAGRVILDLWGNPFSDDAMLLNQLKQAGITNDLLVIKHVWQKCGYDNCYPSVLPANLPMGGDAGLSRLSEAARDAGYLFALHENYIDLYPNSDLWNPLMLAFDSAGARIKAWYNPTTQIQSYLLSPLYALDLASQFSPQIHERYGTTASFVDGLSAGTPWNFEDYNGKIPGTAEQQTTFSIYAQLAGYERQTHNGPILSEGNNHFMYAGLIDGVEAQFEDLDYAPIQPIVDFDLLKIHPLAVNHGMGYYERFFGTAGGNYEQRFDFSNFDPEGFYTYMSTEIAFCHAGFVSSPERLGTYVWLTQVRREVSLVLPIQERCALAQPTQILYNVDGSLAPVEQAVIKNQAWQVFVSYDSGLQVYVNRDPSKDWTVMPSSPQSWVDYRARINNLPTDYVGNQSLQTYVLPPNGWLAFMP